MSSRRKCDTLAVLVNAEECRVLVRPLPVPWTEEDVAAIVEDETGYALDDVEWMAGEGIKLDIQL